MSKNVAVFVDVANLYYSARGQDVDVDYVALLKTATKGRDLIRAYAYSGLDPENENQRKFIDFLGKNGYKVMTKDIRKFGDGRVKANLDIELVVDLFRLADRMDIAVIVSGDGDFAPAIRALQDKGVRCEVISFRPNTSSDLIAVTDEFIDIMKIAGIGRNSKEAKAQRGMSAPEMPAKEVTPEFGFREASPGVAKAALAALREGKAGPTEDAGRGRRRSRSTAAAAADEPAETTVPETEATPEGISAATNGDDQPRKRRRRRGGRGRGRGGRGHAEETGGETNGAESEDGALGWVELDDLSQLSELEGIGDVESEREYSFEEADEATLAELGITPGPAADAEPTDEAAAAPEPEAPPKRRTRARAKTADEAAATSSEEPAKKPARRRSTTTRSASSRRGKSETAATEAEAPASEAPAGEGADAKPRSRSRSRTAKKDSGEGTSEGKPARRPRARKPAGDQAEGEGAAGSEEGIWQRFRSARGTKQGS